MPHVADHIGMQRCFERFATQYLERFGIFYCTSSAVVPSFCQQPRIVSQKKFLALKFFVTNVQPYIKNSNGYSVLEAVEAFLMILADIVAALVFTFVAVVLFAVLMS